jgi:hypothetical protein
VPVAALAIAAVAVTPPLSKAKAVPRIHDISTDFTDPPARGAPRAARPRLSAYGGEKVPRKARKGYPDIAVAGEDRARDTMQRDRRGALGGLAGSRDYAAAETRGHADHALVRFQGRRGCASARTARAAA